MKKLFALLVLLFAVSVGYAQDNIKMVFYQKQLNEGGRLASATTTTKAFLKSYTEKGRDKEVHYHDEDLGICKTYYLFSEGDAIQYDAKLQYAEAKASTDSVNPDNGEILTMVLWYNVADMKIAVHIIRNGVSYMYYANELEMTEDGLTSYEPLTKW